MNSTRHTASSTAPTSGSTPVFRSFADTIRVPLGDNKELVYNPLTGSSIGLTASLSVMVQACTRFASLEEHASNFCDQFKVNRNELPNVLQNLARLTAAGLLVSEQDLVNRCTVGGASTGDSRQISVISIPTKNRTERLKRCLDQYVSSLVEHGRKVSFCIGDDSDNPDSVRANREVLEGVSTSSGMVLRHLTTLDKRGMAQALAKECDLDLELLQFALAPSNSALCTTGANRNALLLAAIDELLLQADDDTLPALAPVTQNNDRLVLSSRDDNTELWFENEEAFKSGSLTMESRDLLAVHEQLLGKPLGALVKEARQTIDVSAANSSFFRKLEPNGGRVVVTSPGFVGDSGMASSLYFLMLNGPSRERLLNSESTYRKMLSTHKLRRSVTNTTVTDGAFCMAMNLGLDNHYNLPPFMPIYRNAEGTFAMLIKFASVGGFLGFLPYMIGHDRPEPSKAHLETFAQRGYVRFSELFLMLIRNTPASPHNSTEQRLSSVGKALLEIASLPAREFQERMKFIVWQESSKKIAFLHQLLQKFDNQPAFWATDAKAYIDALQKTLPAPDFIVPEELKHLSLGEATNVFRKTVSDFGKLLCAWQTIRNGAKSLKNRGVEFGALV